MRRKVLFAAIVSALGATAASAQESESESLRHHTDIEEIIVRALPFQRTSLESAQPVDVLVGERLDDRRGLTLGETLQVQPGVHSSYYGAGSGRPIIRGLGGGRVAILEDGLSTADASAQSDDHAVSVDPMLIDQIEVLRGPATLLYGSAASGGVINIIDNRIPEQVPLDGLTGRFEVRGDSVADERSGVFRLDGGSGNIAWHLDGSKRDADDFRIPGDARLHDDHDDHGQDEHGHDDPGHDDHDDDHSDRLFNSFVESRSATAGLSWIGDRGFVGASVREYRSEYGIPAPHAHVEDAHDDHGHDDHGHDEPGHHGEEEDEFAFVDMEQRSWDIKAGLNNPLSGIARATLRLGYNDYSHSEIELDDHGQDHGHSGTVFDIQTYQGRLMFETEPLADWEGAFGLQFDQEDFAASGAEAFVPNNKTNSIGVFALQERRFGDLTLSLGARLEDSRTRLSHHDDHDDHGHDEPGHDDHGHDEPGHDEPGHDDHGHDDHVILPDVEQRSFTTWSGSIGGIWRIDERWQTSLNFSRAQRAPSATELFADGPHLATFSFDEGDPRLNKETTHAWDWSIHRHVDFFDVELSLFQKDINDFIYLADTDEIHSGLPVREAVQRNAEFWGGEVQAVHQIFTEQYGHFDVRASYDMVRGSLTDGSNLPRMSPQRFGTGLDWHMDQWRAGLDLYRVLEQNRTAEFESHTPGYTMVNVRLAYEWDLPNVQLEAFVQGKNLGNQNARVATSFLKDYAPLPGRNFVIGLRGRF